MSMLLQLRIKNKNYEKMLLFFASKHSDASKFRCHFSIYEQDKLHVKLSWVLKNFII